jgi:hypothetical protein
MGHGGPRPGSGRKKGQVSAPTRRRLEAAERALAAGLNPLDYIMSILRDENAPPEQRYKAAVDAAPYVHPRLAAVEAKVAITEHEDSVRALYSVVTATSDHDTTH